MRQTFKVPALDADHRYRIVVGGSGHPWSGEGFALYLDGKQVDLLPDFADGTVTIAVKALLRRNGHRNKAAAPSGHMSVWLESAKLSPVALKAAAKTPL